MKNPERPKIKRNKLGNPDGEIELNKELEYVKAEVEKAAKKNCNKCYGIGYIGINRITKKLVVCKCVAKKLIEYQIKKRIAENEKRNAVKKRHEKKI